ncbi:RNA-binding transcriptional accessory protein [Candidatus Bipolaricaulota bacterium]|nr:RNA-binding transcriptional accessory protein [Candidatus Bipolaricaulota bacterium]TFH08313.1 MAG: RNA-binding transcriptional accessory protein [Candidatus Atribacteria bacterium]
MHQDHFGQIAAEFGYAPRQVRAAAELLDDGSTVPFISRYRKEMTGSLDEVAIAAIRDRLRQLRQLNERRDTILSSLEEREMLTQELKDAIEGAKALTELEDIYLPFRPKRRTRAMIAREKGLEPLADQLMQQDSSLDPVALAAAFVDAEMGVDDADDALAGARDILAESVNESAEARAEVRLIFEKKATLRTAVIKGKEEEGASYRDYFDWQEPISKAPAHRIHAMLRAEREGIIRLAVRPDDDVILETLSRRFVRGRSQAADQVALAVEDGYKRLMAPSIENEVRARLAEMADREAVRVFADNLRHLLLAPPLGQKRLLAIDPGYRTGCKLACLDAQGRLLAHAVVYVVGSKQQVANAGQCIIDLVKAYHLAAIAIGNGTASRETEELVRSLDFSGKVPIVMVSEAGASVYSASEIARKEFPHHDVTVRGAVSIGRRLMDPLAELVKIDPKSIGVGQYQHDVDQGMLKQSLDDVIEHCVNAVGVEVNTASVPLLSHVSGLGPKLAENIVAHRDENGPFKKRSQLKKVPRVGPKAFEQAAGFLRIRDGDDPLDASAVHPESYSIVRQMAADLDCSVTDLIHRPDLRDKIDLDLYVTETVGLPTLTDILAELAKPGRDPRDSFEVFSFAEGITEIKDLAEGMRLPGIVTNVVNFGAFVDIGVHQDGLVHISQLADKFIKDPSTIVKVGQHVTVTVMEVDVERRRIGLSMKKQSSS